MSADLPDWTASQASESWKLVLPCTKAEAEAVAEDIGALADLDPPPTLMTSEPDPAREDDWLLEAYFEGKPSPDAIAMVRALVPSADGVDYELDRIEDADWVTLSQAFLEPIRAGRFFVHTAAHAAAVPNEVVAFHIEAGRAFGTGHHETTTGCLHMIDGLKTRGHRFRAIADVGTGTGLLAFAARAVWPRAAVIASDIDPISIDVTAENAALNAIPTGTGRGQVALVTAPGLADATLVRRAPYDLLIANILAGPLIALAPTLSAALQPGGSLILAGLLNTQADRVIAAYRRQGLRLAERIDTGDWPTLRLVRRTSARVRTLPERRDTGLGDWSTDGA
ncbi:50S ribosomal protein L11 methyltransferase [Sphingomonas montana]|uniref:50S ribosomal protein L11 methyltransferase n=1 Tax=Sphingomonas montana TaxID=1843236 RepID=UPI00097009CE|nr:50S ribosomal protein L11 methyltransferase [Sphingomonas montana]